MTVLFLINIVILCCYIILLFYYRVAWDQLPAYRRKVNAPAYKTKISIIIPARNEEENIPGLLCALSAQTYPSRLFEVLIIDDHSSDHTLELVKAETSENIRSISLSDHIPSGAINSYKKKAIETGIKQSTGTLIVTTDADCYFPPEWLETMAGFYEEFSPKFIAAPVSINCNTSFIQLFQSLDFMALQGITGAAVHKKMLSMCNGANMAYEKSAFVEAGGFANIDSIASGDDMLLMHKIEKLYPDKIMFLKSRDAIVQTSAVRTIREFFNQRIRWASKAGKYDDKRILPVLMLVYFMNVLFLLSGIASLFTNETYFLFSVSFTGPGIFIIMLLCKIFVELYFLYPVADFFRKTKELYVFPLMQPLHILYTVIAGWLGKFGNYTWKGRYVK